MSFVNHIPILIIIFLKFGIMLKIIFIESILILIIVLMITVCILLIFLIERILWIKISGLCLTFFILFIFLDLI